jgi:hypothetical protein
MAVLARQGSYGAGLRSLVQSVCPAWSAPIDSIGCVDRFLRHYFVYREERDEVLRDVPFMLHDLETLGYMEGDCDDQTIMACAMLHASNILCRMTAIKSQNDFEFDHVFSEARIGDYWLPVDPTVPTGTTYMQYGYMSEVV